jgi:hypothetical protein
MCLCRRLFTGDLNDQVNKVFVHLLEDNGGVPLQTSSLIGGDDGCLLLIPTVQAPPPMTLPPLSRLLLVEPPHFLIGVVILRPCLLPDIFIPERCGDMWGFGVHPILSNPLKYSSPKILYHDGEFLI